jgi:hypothetical protein
MRDTDGNEYVYVLHGDVFGADAWCLITPGSFTTARLTSTSRGPVGIVMAQSTSETYGWVKVYGTHATAQIGSSSFTSAYFLTQPAGATTASALIATSAAADFASGQVFNAWLSGASATTTATSQLATGYLGAVHLNYPSVNGYTIGASTPGSS